MSSGATRRQFLRDGTHLAAGTLAAGWLPAAAGAIEPLVRNGQPKFKFSLAAYSYRKLLQGNPPELTLTDFIADCAKMGLEGTELTSYYFPSEPKAEYLHQLKNAAFRLGLDVSGTAVGNDFCHPPGEARDKQLAYVKRWVDHAELLNAPVIRIFAGRVKKDQTADEAHRLCVAGIEECCDYAGKHGVMLALENHGGITATPESILRLVRDVKSPWFGVNLDTGNFHTSDVYGDLAQLAPYSVNVQIKVVISPAGGGKQETDFKRLAAILRDVAYRGYVVLEYEESGDPRQECPKFVDKMREAFA